MDHIARTVTTLSSLPKAYGDFYARKMIRQLETLLCDESVAE
jgi:hypothetical protein